MLHPIAIENDQLKVQVWPGYGGKVASVVDKADGTELMFSYPRELPTTPHYDIDYADGWYAGWDECFPGIARGPYPARPYEGAIVPDHGELWGLPVRVLPQSNGIKTEWHGLRFGYHFTRHLRLEASTLVADYELENLSPFDFHFVWALHSLMAMPPGVMLEHTGDDNWRWSHDAHGGQHNKPFTWPVCHPGEDLTRMSELPAGRGWKVFSVRPIDRPLTILYPNRKRKLAISYISPSDVRAFWGIWINTGGWSGHRHFAVEPTTGLHDRLDESVRDSSAAKVGPLAKVNWTVKWTVG